MSCLIFEEYFFEGHRIIKNNLFRQQRLFQDPILSYSIYISLYEIYARVHTFSIVSLYLRSKRKFWQRLLILYHRVSILFLLSNQSICRVNKFVWLDSIRKLNLGVVSKVILPYDVQLVLNKSYSSNSLYRISRADLLTCPGVPRPFDSCGAPFISINRYARVLRTFTMKIENQEERRNELLIDAPCS